MTIRELGWPTIIALLLALATAIVAVSSDSLAMAMYRWWWLPVAGIAATILAAWRDRRPWVLLLLVTFLVPAIPILALLAACATGNCL